LPVLLIALGSAYGIHLIIHYLAECGAETMTREEHNELVLAVVMKMLRAVFITAITTVVAFGSFCFTNVAPCREFGYFASFGVAVAFIVSITLIPALLIIRGPKHTFARQAKARGGKTGSSAFADTLVSAAHYKKTIFFISALVAVISLYGLSKLIIDNVMIEYFRDDTDISKSDRFIRRQFGGSKVISVVAEADSPNIILRPDTLAAMDGLSEYLHRKVPDTGKVMGFTDLIKRINQVFYAHESPLGIGSREWGGGNAALESEEDQSSGDDFGFGFGFDDDFGFGDFALNDNAVTEPEASTDNSGDKIYTRDELFALLDKAGNLFRGMNANDLVWELKRQVNHEGASYFEIPVDPKRYGKKNSDELRQLIANYLVLLSGSIESYANDSLEPTAIKSTVQLRTVGMTDSEAVFSEIERYIAANFPSDVKVTMGGTTKVEISLNNLVVQSQLSSLLISAICIFIIISIANRSPVAGLFSLAPLSISVLINFAIMGFMGIKLNLGTSMVACVSVGVGIDYAIHCLEAYKREYRAGEGTYDCLRRTFISSGRAIVIDAVSNGAGFAVLMFSRFTMLADLGLLIAVAMFSSALASLTLLPALLAVIKPKFMANGGV
jgi:predicted RND superfamily exporter protein